MVPSYLLQTQTINHVQETRWSLFLESIVLKTYAGALSVLIYTGIYIMAIAYSKCVITESVFSELKAVVHWNPEYVLWYGTHVLIL